MHALWTGLIVAAIVALIAWSPVTGGFMLHRGSPQRYPALGALMLLGFILGALGALAAGE